MSLLGIPSELLTLIIQDLSFQDLNAVVQCHPTLYYAFKSYLYARGMKHKTGYPLW